MAAINNIVRSVSPKTIFPDATKVISSAVSYNQGDLLIFNTSTKLIAAAAAESDGSTFLGVATETVVSGKLASPYVTPVDASAAVTSVPGPQYGVVALLTLKTGDALLPGGLVYLNPAGGTQHVQASGTKSVGVYQGSTIASASAGQQIEVLLGCRYPSDALLF